MVSIVKGKTDKSGVKRGTEYAELTDLMSKTWSGMTTGEYKKYKDLKKGEKTKDKAKKRKQLKCSFFLFCKIKYCISFCYFDRIKFICKV